MLFSNIYGIYLYLLKILLCCKTSFVKVILVYEFVELFIKLTENVVLFDKIIWRYVMSDGIVNWKG